MNRPAPTPAPPPLDRAQAIDLAREYAAAIRAQFGARVRDLRLYGSATRGDWTAASDIDVLVLLDHVETADEEWLVHRAVELGLLRSGVVLQPLFMAETQFREMQQRERAFALSVAREGIAL